MDLETFILSELSQTEKKKYMTSLICGIKKEMIQMNLLMKQKLTQAERMNLWLWRWGAGLVRELRMVMHTLLYLKWTANKDLL